MCTSFLSTLGSTTRQLTTCSSLFSFFEYPYYRLKDSKLDRSDSFARFFNHLIFFNACYCFQQPLASSGVATGGLGGTAPTFAEIVLKISLKSMRKWVWGGGSSKCSEKYRAWPNIFIYVSTYLSLACPCWPLILDVRGSFTNTTSCFLLFPLFHTCVKV